MKTINTSYWIVTIAVAVFLTVAGILDVTHFYVIDISMKHLGYPMYVSNILGTCKLLGVIALLVPKLPTIKEWAYAGFVYDLTGAFISHKTAGDPVWICLAPVLPLVLLITSYILYKKRMYLKRTETYQAI